MAKRVFIIHGWGGTSKTEWLPWLKMQLEERGFEVTMPDMPDTERPVIGKWVPFLARLVKVPDKDTYFVGHSIGAQAILRYLIQIRESDKVGGAVLVAPWITLTEASYVDEEGREIAKPWLESPIDWKNVISHTKRFIVIFSDDDPFVPLSNSKVFKEKLNAEIIIEHGKSHMHDETGIKELPSAFNAILKLAK